MTDRAGQDCSLCAEDQVDPRDVVFRDDLWACELMPGSEVPGWFALRTRRHAERWTGLDAAELASIGWRAQMVIRAIAAVFGSEVNYFMVFGENHAHFHALIASRGDEVPRVHRGGELLRLRDDLRDHEAARAFVPAVRAAYHSLTRGEEAVGS